MPEKGPVKEGPKAEGEDVGGAGAGEEVPHHQVRVAIKGVHICQEDHRMKIQ